MIKPTRRIAVVDDDLAVRKSLGRLLETASYSVQTFESASEFIFSLVDDIPACALVDLQMPHMTGLQLQEYLANAGIKLPIIVITANDETRTKEQCMALGAKEYLVKPLQRTTLLAAIDAAIT